jgi:hypothetical protein
MKLRSFGMPAMKPVLTGGAVLLLVGVLAYMYCESGLYHPQVLDRSSIAAYGGPQLSKGHGVNAVH